MDFSVTSSNSYNSYKSNNTSNVNNDKSPNVQGSRRFTKNKNKRVFIIGDKQHRKTYKWL